MLKNLGSKMRHLRKEKGLTLIEVAERTNIAQASLSRMETGSMTGTLESHIKIAEALGIGLSDLYTDIDKRYDEIKQLKKDQKKVVTHQTKSVRMELLTTAPGKKKMTPLLMTLAPHAKSSKESLDRGIEKFMMVLEGAVHVSIDKQTYELSGEETLYFDASLPHFIENKTAQKAKLLITVSSAIS